MDYLSQAGVIIIACVVILCVISLKKKAEYVLNFLLRGITGAILIFLVNLVMVSQNMTVLVGINLWTVLTSGILGIPGVILLYGIHILKFL